MKVVLCISAHFPPVNAADMHRLRQALPYFKSFGWKPVVFCVDPKFVELSQDILLVDSVPSDIEVYSVNAFSTSWTRKIGLGNIGFRSWFQYKYAIDQYIKSNEVELIYFSTTVFTLMSLGVFWKKKHGIPFVVDLQDPWRNDYYLTLTKKNRPPKFWFDYRQKKYLESMTMPNVSGIISVSDGYIDVMKKRYNNLQGIPSLTIPFGALELDFEISKNVQPMMLNTDVINIVYIGRGGSDMALSISSFFQAVKKGLDNASQVFTNLRLSFIGTSYAAQGKGVEMVMPYAKKIGVESMVYEQTDRLPFYQSLSTLQSADLLFIPGSIDDQYTASKIFPYIMSKKPLLAVFNKKSSVVDILKDTNIGNVVTFSSNDTSEIVSNRIYPVLKDILSRIPYRPELNVTAFERYTAKEMTKKQCLLFDDAIQ